MTTCLMLYVVQENDTSSDRCSHCQEITRELAEVKLAYAEAMNVIECKKKDLREVEEGGCCAFGSVVPLCIVQ